MGVVYEAEDLNLKRHVVLKFLPEELLNDPRFIERFKIEARVTSALNHPHICTIHDVLELMEGRTLKHRINGQPIEICHVLEIGIQIADALDAALTLELAVSSRLCTERDLSSYDAKSSV